MKTQTLTKNLTKNLARHKNRYRVRVNSRGSTRFFLCIRVHIDYTPDYFLYIKSVIRLIAALKGELIEYKQLNFVRVGTSY